ncbi:hypothetical protein JK636_19180 [Clostridium sp. YIM B02515]|uniref:DUF624 domain-containing protein n=1 Tax=Clostridium rhizosphaerae TaxID=2803861 RepID=A0ABS1THL7_9CLOT|nr:hypothetical protein [Clostridium rhizosphaerae]MBL4937834.1 hypothetical protein [Clostridium rhizosphaerae]
MDFENKNGIYKISVLLSRLVVTNLIFLLLSPLIITAGVTISGMMYVLNDPNKPIRSFIKFFKANFLKSIPLTIFMYSTLSTGYFLYFYMSSNILTIIIWACLSGILFGYSLIILFLFSKYEMTLVKYFQSGFYLLLQNYLVIILQLLLFFVITYIVLAQSILLFIMFAVSINVYLFARFNNKSIENLYQKSKSDCAETAL